jgi:hypothetical protein
MQAIALIKTFISFVGAKVAVALNVAAGAQATMAIGSAVIAGTALVAKKAMSLFEVDMAMPDTDRSRQSTVKSATAPQKFIYGKALVSGPVSFIGLGGSDNEDLYQTIVLAGHECASIDDVYFDDLVITKQQINSGNQYGGAVNGGAFNAENGVNIVTINKYLGAASQTADSMFTTQFGNYTSDHRGDGIAYLAMKWVLNADSAKTWDKFAPQNVSALVRGRLIYDPRLEVAAGGTAGATPSNSNYIAYSDNPALCAIDYLMDQTIGLKVPATKIAWDQVITAANGCDVTVTIPNGTEKTFACNGVVFATDSHQKNLNKILSSMNGTLVYSNGKYVIRAGIYTAPTVSLNEDSLVGSISVKTSIDRSERVNTIKGLFIDPAQGHKMVEFPTVQLSTELQRDNNQVMEKETQLTMTNTSFMAQRLAHKIIKAAGQQKVITFPANYSALNITAGDRVQVSIEELSWVNKIFICVSWVFSEDGGIALTLREDSPDAYSNPTSYSQISGTGTITDASRGVPSPSGLQVESAESKIFLNWVNPSKPSDFNTIEVWVSATNVRSNAVKLGETNGTQFTHDQSNAAITYAVGDTLYYWIRAKKNVGAATDTTAVSGYFPATTTSSANVTVTAAAVDWTNVANPTIGIDINNDTISINTGVANTTTGQTVAKSGIEAGTTVTQGGITMNQGGSIKGGQSAYNSGTGFFLGYDTNKYKFSIGNAGTEALTFDGTNLAVTGAITATSGSIGNSVTVGGTAASTVASEAAAGNQAADQISLLPRADDSEWTVGTGAKGIWSLNGEISENAVVVENGPHGELERIWKATSTDGSNADGGFQNTATDHRFPIASDTAYRFSVFIKQDNTNGTIYLGAYNFSGSSTLSLYRYDGNSPTTNRYWFGSDLPTQGEWYLLVGFINPSNTNANSGKGGIYNLSTGVKVNSFEDFRFSGDGSETDATTFAVRTYNYYGVASPTSIARWAHPRVDRLDRRAPSIAELLRGWTSLAEPINAGVTITGGGITMSGGGSIKGGQTAFNTGTGFFLGYDAATPAGYKLSVGNPQANHLTFENGALSVSGAITASSFVLSGITIPKTDLATAVQTSLDTADSALQDADTGVNLGITDGSVGGISVDATKLYAGTGTWGNTNTGFYLDDSGKFSLKDSLTFDPSTGSLQIVGSIETDVLTVNEQFNLFGNTFFAHGVKDGAITADMLAGSAINLLQGSLAQSVGGSNGDFKEGTGTFTTTTGGSIVLGTSGDLFDHGELGVEVEANFSISWNSATEYSTDTLTLQFQASTDGTNYTNVGTSHTVTISKYDLSEYYPGNYYVYYSYTDITETIPTSSASPTPAGHLENNVDYYIRALITSVPTSVTGQTPSFTFSANEGVTGVTSTGGNADTLDNLDSTAFLRSNVNDTFDADLVITGNLTVQGTTTTINVADLTVADKDITLNYSTGDSSATANNAGIIIQDAVSATADASILWKTATDSFEFSHPVNPLTVNSSLNLQSAGGVAGIYLQDTSGSSTTTAFRFYSDVDAGTVNIDTGGTQTIAAFVDNGNLLITGTIYADGAASNSTQWKTGYDYSQIGHLPLAGGTLTGAVSSNSSITTSGLFSAQYYNGIGGQELILTAGESKSQLQGVTGGNPLDSEFVYAVAEGGLLVISSPDNWLDTGTTYYNDASWAKRHQTYINDSNGNSTFAGKVTAKTNYVYGGLNYHFVLSEDTNPAYISNVNGDGILSTGGYYYGSNLRQLNSGQTSYAAVRVRQNGSFVIEQIVGATAGSAATHVTPLSIGTDGVTNITNISTGDVNANEVHGRNIGHVEQDYLFAITDWDTDDSIRRKFNTSSTNVTRVYDSDAPASGVFQVVGGFNADFGKLIPLGEEDEIVFECWAKYVSGGDSTGNFYAGSSFYDGSQAYLGNTQRYWGASGNSLDSDHGTWRHIRGVLNVENLRTVSATSTARYARLINLFNYNAGDNTTRYCGFKFYRSKKSVTTLYHTGNLRGSRGFSADWEGTQTKIIDGSGNITSAGTFNSPIGMAIDAAGSFYVPEYLYHQSDADTFVRFLDNRIILKAGNVDAIDIHSNGNMYFHRPIISYGTLVSGAITSSARMQSTSIRLASGGNLADAQEGEEYKYYLSGMGLTDGLWKKVCDVAVASGLYKALAMKIILDSQGSNFGSSRIITSSEFTAVYYRSGGTQDNPNNASIDGENTDNHELRIIKTGTGAYELQIKMLSAYKDAFVKVEVLSTNGGTVTIASDIANGSTSGTVYSPSPNNNTTKIYNALSSSAISVGQTSNSLGASFEALGTDARIQVHNSGNSRGGIAAFASQKVALYTTNSNDDLFFGSSSDATNTNFVQKMRLDNGTGHLTVSGPVTSSGRSFFGSTTGITGTSTDATTNVSYLAFYELDNTSRQGYVGYGSSGNQALYLTNDRDSEINLRVNSSDRITVNSTSTTIQGTVSSGAITSSGKIRAPKLSIQNQINTTSANLEINYENGDGTTASFKDFYVRDGKNGLILLIDGSSKTSTFAGDILLDSDNAEINIKSGIGGTSGAVNWTFNSTGIDYASLKLPYDTRATTGFHIDSGYPITVDATTRIRFDIAGSNKGDWDASRLYVASYISTPYVDARYFVSKPNGAIRFETINNIQNYGQQSEVLFDTTSILSNRQAGIAGPSYVNTLAAADFSYNPLAPGVGGSVIRTSTYRLLYSDYIPVTPGEVVFGEMWSRNISGTGGLIYYGIERYDSQKRPIAANTGTSYFVVTGVNQTSTNWVRYSNSQRIPTSHAIYEGSDGGGVYYIRVRILLNHSTGGALREFSGIQLTRMNRMSTNLAFGHAGPWGGSQKGTRFAAIEGNTDALGEGSGRLFFSEHNSTIAAADNYGMSLGYRGTAATNPSITTTAGNAWTGLSQINNGCWGMWGHHADLTGALIMDGDREATRINFNDNKLYLGNKDSTTYLQSDASYLKVQTASGECKIGAGNTSYVHFTTDRGRFYFNTGIVVNSGVFASYDEDLVLQRAASATYKMTLSTSGATFTHNVTAYSDRRLKEDIKPIKNALDTVLKLEGVTYKRIDNGENNLGFIAQQIEESAPEISGLVVGEMNDERKTKHVNYANMVALLTTAIQEQQDQINELKQTIEDMKNGTK